MDYLSLLWSLVVLASLDSINPCAMSMTASISLIASSLVFRGFSAFRYPLLFVLGVYIGYLLLGFLLSWILGFSRILLVLVVFLAFTLALLDLREALSERSAACRVGECAPLWFRVLDPRISPLLLVVSGVVVSWSFMMCSAAPYLVFLGILGYCRFDDKFEYPWILVNTWSLKWRRGVLALGSSPGFPGGSR